ncbi:MAG: hypothetical protein ACRYGA_04555 [Janthinobacterium lividum]
MPSFALGRIFAAAVDRVVGGRADDAPQPLVPAPEAAKAIVDDSQSKGLMNAVRNEILRVEHSARERPALLPAHLHHNRDRL